MPAYRPPVGRRVLAARSWSAREPAERDGYPRQAARTRCATPGSGARSTGAGGRRRACRPETLQVASTTSRASRWCRRRELRAAQARASALRRLPLHRAGGGGAHPRHERHHRPAHRVRHRRRRLGAHRRGARAHPVGRGHPPGRPRARSAPSSASIWARGARWRAASGWAPPSFPFGAGAPGQTLPGRAVGARSAADRVLRHAVLRAALRGDRAARGHRPGGRSASALLFFSGEPGAGIPADQGADRADLRRASAWTWAAWRR